MDTEDFLDMLPVYFLVLLLIGFLLWVFLGNHDATPARPCERPPQLISRP